MNAGKNGTVHMFLKIGKEEHITALYNKGEMYFNTRRYFNNAEGNKQQKDNFEGATSFEPIGWLEITAPDGRKIKFGNTPDCDATITDGNMLFHPDASLGNIFCLFSVTQEFIDTETHVDERNREFGNTMLMIRNPKAFLERTCNALDQKGIKYQYGLVEYFDSKNSKEKLSPFKKRDKYRHQYEFRFFIENETETPFTLHIGSLADIADLHSVDKVSGIFQEEVIIETDE